MHNNLTNKNKKESQGSLLTKKPNMPFRIAIDDSLENRYCFKDLKGEGIKSFHSFIEETVGKDLSIGTVDDLFLRTKGPVKEKMTVHGSERDVIHYGKDRKPFRVFGYYNQYGYFVLTRIDPKHKTHR